MPVLQPGGVSTNGAGVQRQLVSDLSIIKPQYYTQFIEKYGSQNYAQLLDALGMKATVNSKKFGHFETRGKLHDNVKVLSFTGGASAGATATITVDTSSIIDTDPSASVANKSPVRVGEVLENAKNGKQYKVTSIGTYPNIFTITPFDSTELINATLVAADFLLFRGISEAGEASTKFDTLTSLVEEKTFYTTEIREDFTISDRAKIEELWFDVNGQPYYTYKGLDEAVRRFMNNKEFKLMFGRPQGSTGTSGLIAQVEAGGQTTAWGTTFDIDDFHNLARLADFNGGAQEYHFLMDSYLRTSVDDALFTKYQNGSIVWASVGGSSEVALKYGFDSLKIDGTTFHLKKYLPFNMEAVYGQTISAGLGGYYARTGLLIPVKDGRDAQTGDKIPSLRVVYNEVEAGKELKIWETGALAKVPTSDKMELNVHHMSYCGIQLFAVNQFIKVTYA
jgi:hypothetical protein